METIRTYSELIELPTFKDRYRYLKIGGRVGEDTFGFDRYINQAFYKSSEWKRLRNSIIVRDHGCDLAVDGNEIYGTIIIHHLNPICDKDILEHSDYLMDPEFLITTSLRTHNAIHYGDESLLNDMEPTVRTPNDTCPWRQ